MMKQKFTSTERERERERERDYKTGAARTAIGALSKTRMHTQIHALCTQAQACAQTGVKACEPAERILRRMTVGPNSRSIAASNFEYGSDTPRDMSKEHEMYLESQLYSVSYVNSFDNKFSNFLAMQIGHGDWCVAVLGVCIWCPSPSTLLFEYI
jgi:hypothetical protein